MDKPKRSRPDPKENEAVQAIFDTWLLTNPGKGGRTLTSGRARAIDKALKLFPADDVMDAVLGWPYDPWDDRPQHNDVTVLLREGNVEKFPDLYRNRNQPKAKRNGLHQPAANDDPIWNDPDAYRI